MDRCTNRCIIIEKVANGDKHHTIKLTNMNIRCCPILNLCRLQKALKEYRVSRGKKELQESMDSCTSHHDVTKIM